MQYGSLPNMNLDVLVMSDGLWRTGEANTCELSGGGTSIGTPTLAGVVGLMKSVNSCLHPADIEEILVLTSQPIPANAGPQTTRGGLIDAYAAVMMAQNFEGIDRTLSGNQLVEYFYVSGGLTIEPGADITISHKLETGNNANVIIEAGAKLTLSPNSVGEMGDLSRIIVKRGAHLIVDGSHLKVDNCASQWQGIVVEGNSKFYQQLSGQIMEDHLNGIVEIKNGAIIEGAKTAISMNADHVPWPHTQAMRGGLVVAENSTFLNNDRALEFMQYRNKDFSRITNCVFSGHKHASTHWHNSGVVYDGCSFDNYIFHAILTIDAVISVINGCSFDSEFQTNFLTSAIDATFTLPNPNFSIIEQYRIGDLSYAPNDFYGGVTGFFCNACAQTDFIQVQNNIFFLQEFGSRFDGVGNYDVSKNDFIGCTTANMLVSTGDNENLVTENNLSSSGVGLFYYFDNSKSQFLSNCFDFTWDTDVRLHEGSLNEDIGNIDQAASNVFTDIISHRKFVRTGGTVPSYHILAAHKSNWQNVRQVPHNKNSNEFEGNVYFSTEEDLSNCGSTSTSGPTQIDFHPCKIPADCADIETYIVIKTDLLAVHKGLFANAIPYSAEWYRQRYKIFDINKCLREARLKLIQKDCFNRNEDMVGRFAEEEFVEKTYVLGSLIGKDSLTDASVYLDTLYTSSQEQLDFVTIQKINLKRFIDESYTPSQDTLDLIYDIGLKIDPLAAYARGLYRYFTGEKILLGLPVPDSTQTRSTINNVQSYFKTQPNPFTQNFTLQYKIDQPADLAVYDFVGNKVYTYCLDPKANDHFVNIDFIPTGPYFLLIRNNQDGNLLYSAKLIKID